MNKIKAIISPVVEEAGKFVDTAREQVTFSDADQGLEESTKQLVEGIYKPEVNKSPDELVKQKAKEKKDLAKTRAKLAAHQRYVQSIINPPKAPEEPKADELERKKNQERWELKQKENEKPPPLAIRMGAQKTEKYPGASG